MVQFHPWFNFNFSFIEYNIKEKLRRIEIIIVPLNLFVDGSKDLHKKSFTGIKYDISFGIEWVPGLEIIFESSLVKMSGHINFSSVMPRFRPDKCSV